MHLKKIFLEYPKLMNLYKKLIEKQRELKSDKEISFLTHLISLFYKTFN